MKKLKLKETTEIIGGTPTGRRCDRLARREIAGPWRAGDTWARICEGAGEDGGNIGSY